MLFEKDSGEWLSVRVRNRSSWVAGSEADGAGEGRRWWATEDERKEVMVEGEGEGYSVECKSLSIFDQKSNVDWPNRRIRLRSLGRADDVCEPPRNPENREDTDRRV